MFARVASFRQWLQRRWLYSGISVLTIFIVTVGQPQIGRAAEWWQILIQAAPSVIEIVKLNNITDAQEASFGAETNQALLSDKVRLYRNSAVTSYVDRIGQRLARNSTRSNIKYTFQVIDDDAINAFATMGGYVYVNTG
ncbi:MAG: M48 family metalloprotease, partial [Chamaesiphon sp.]|nr:M48 family metalloprotease [Chamaesiphon sp.]